MSAIEALLTRMIDYAGLFAPASLDMATAVRNYHDYLRGEHAWMLGNFIVPARRLAEFTEAFNEVCCEEQESPWTLSVVCLEEDPRDDGKLIDAFQEGAAYLSAFEAKAIHEAAAWNILAALPRSGRRYIEFPPDLAPGVLPVLNEYEARAKIRTGGITADAIPQPETILRFLRACLAQRVAFKATAGLHHAVRGMHRLTYSLSTPVAKTHGFLNVFLCAGLAMTGAVDEALMRTLLEEDAQVFQLDDGWIKWHDQRLSAEQIFRLRTTLADGFGSCSFTEPIDDLKTMGWL